MTECVLAVKTKIRFVKIASLQSRIGQNVKVLGQRVLPARFNAPSVPKALKKADWIDEAHVNLAAITTTAGSRREDQATR